MGGPRRRRPRRGHPHRGGQLRVRRQFPRRGPRLGVDAYVTSDLRHHPVDEYLRAGGPPVIDTAHWASEFPWAAQAAGIVGGEAGVETHVIDLRTDPWTLSAHASNAHPSK